MLEHKFCETGEDAAARESARLRCDGEGVISGYASLFGLRDQSGDVVAAGACQASLRRLEARGGKVRMLWQHDPAQPIGVWDEVREDERGLWVRGHLLPEVARGREAMALLAAGAIDGLSIGYRTLRAGQGEKGGRILHEIELWEVSLVTFPMLPDARASAAKSEQGAGTAADLPAAATAVTAADDPGLISVLQDLADLFTGAGAALAPH